MRPLRALHSKLQQHQSELLVCILASPSAWVLASLSATLRSTLCFRCDAGQTRPVAFDSSEQSHNRDVMKRSWLRRRPSRNYSRTLDYSPLSLVSLSLSVVSILKHKSYVTVKLRHKQNNPNPSCTLIGPDQNETIFFAIFSRYFIHFAIHFSAWVHQGRR